MQALPSKRRPPTAPTPTNAGGEVVIWIWRAPPRARMRCATRVQVSNRQCRLVWGFTFLRMHDAPGEKGAFVCRWEMGDGRWAPVAASFESQLRFPPRWGSPLLSLLVVVVVVVVVVVAVAHRTSLSPPRSPPAAVADPATFAAARPPCPTRCSGEFDVPPHAVAHGTAAAAAAAAAAAVWTRRQSCPSIARCSVVSQWPFTGMVNDDDTDDEEEEEEETGRGRG